MRAIGTGTMGDGPNEKKSYLQVGRQIVGINPPALQSGRDAHSRLVMLTLMTAPSTSMHAFGRVAAGLAGGYAFTWGFVTLGIALLLAAGVDFGEARTLIFLLAFLLFLGVLLWAFVANNLARVWLVLAGGGATMTGAAWLMTRAVA
jgi:hypothetical protein